MATTAWKIACATKYYDDSERAASCKTCVTSKYQLVGKQQSFWTHLLLRSCEGHGLEKSLRKPTRQRSGKLMPGCQARRHAWSAMWQSPHGRGTQ
eukprot:1331720-Amphidinium_carterae.1